MERSSSPRSIFVSMCSVVARKVLGEFQLVQIVLHS